MIIVVATFHGDIDLNIAFKAESTAQVVDKLVADGYTGDANNLIDLIDIGTSIYVRQFDITLQKVQAV